MLHGVPVRATMCPMNAAEHDSARRRLADAIDERRLDLDLRLTDVAERAGITRQTLRRVRFESGEITALTKAGLERSLQWRRGSIDAILRGGDPTPIESPESPGSFRERSDESDVELLNEQEEEIWAIKSIPPDRRWSMILHLRQFPRKDVG